MVTENWATFGRRLCDVKGQLEERRAMLRDSAREGVLEPCMVAVVEKLLNASASSLKQAVRFSKGFGEVRKAA